MDAGWIPEKTAVLALDPGLNTGVAAIDRSGRLLARCVVRLDKLATLMLPVGVTVVLGNGTGSDAAAKVLEQLEVTFELLDETGSSLEGRDLYWRHNPPRGRLRLLPKGLLPNPVDLDAWAAYALGLRWLARQEAR